MSTRVSQPAENFDSTKNLMLEALAKASAELEKSVTAFTEQLISFNESLQKSLDEDLRLVSRRLESSIKGNLDELAHNKHLMVKRLLEAERSELDSLSDTGRQVRASLSSAAHQIEERVEEFIDTQIRELKEYLEEPQQNIEDVTSNCKTELESRKTNAASEIQGKHDEVRRQLSDKVSEMEKQIKQETDKVRDAIFAVSEYWGNSLKSERESFCGEFRRFSEGALSELAGTESVGLEELEAAEAREKAILEEVGARWRQQIDDHCGSFEKLIASLSSALKETFESKLANAADEARQEITLLSDQAHEKIAATRTELEVELKDLEKDYITQLESTLRKLELIVSEHANDKRNNGVARQHKSQKLRDQMHTYLKRWGAGLVDSIKDSATDFENEFTRATDGFHTRIESARASSIELLERESKLMQKDLERTLKEFQKELNQLESQVGQIEKAGQDAAITVITYRKAVLSFRGD